MHIPIYIHLHTHLEPPAVEGLPLKVEGEGPSVLAAHGGLIVGGVERLHEGVRERLCFVLGFV